MTTEYNDFDWDGVPKRKVTPWGQWHHGNPDLEELKGTANEFKYTGGFLIELKNLDPEEHGTEIPGFTKLQLRLGGNPVEVLAASKAEICVVSYRLQFKRKSNGQTTYHPRTEYQSGDKGHLQAAVYLKGFNPLVYFTLTGTTSRDFEEQLKGFRKAVLPIANATAPAGKQLDINAFYLPFGAGAHETRGKGGEQKTVSPLRLMVPGKPTREWLLGQYVGPQLMGQTYEDRKSLEAWRAAWDQAATEATEAEAATEAPAGWATAA